MPLGTSLADTAYLQRRIINTTLPQLGPVVVDARLGSFTFSAALNMWSYPATNNKIYKVAFDYTKASGANLRLQSSSAGVQGVISLATAGKFSSVAYAAASGTVDIAADSASFTGTISNPICLEIPKFTTISGDRYFSSDNYWTLNVNSTFGVNCVNCAAVGFIMRQRTNMLTSTLYNFSFDVNKTSGSELRLSNSITDGTNVVFTTSGLPSGASTVSGSFTTSGANFDWIALGASGGSFTGSISNFVIS